MKDFVVTNPRIDIFLCVASLTSTLTPLPCWTPFESVFGTATKAGCKILKLVNVPFPHRCFDFIHGRGLFLGFSGKHLHPFQSAFDFNGGVQSRLSQNSACWFAASFTMRKQDRKPIPMMKRNPPNKSKKRRYQKRSIDFCFIVDFLSHLVS